MSVQTPIRAIALSPGSHLLIHDMSWEAYETLLHEFGEDCNVRLAYHSGTLSLMSPLPKHERAIVIMSDVVKLILRLQKRPWESLRSSTFKQQGLAGIEPDDCFYIQNYQRVIGKERIDLTVDPPPDLAIESDLTSITETSAYAAIQVPELWIYRDGSLKIKILQGQCYQDYIESPTFPGLAIAIIIPKVIEQAKIVGTSQALMDLEAELSDRV
ncbi:MAG: Uma2 family endonuclease [Cyanothece sp. SIO2G6]|nr:Uma2 family endonuclease [Cyanothece sp. SIO2G6]